MTGSPYSPLKIFHHQERLQQLREGKQPIPCQVQLVISDLCNQDCGFCAYRRSGYSSNQLFVVDSKIASYGHNNPVRMIPYEKILEILDDCKEMGIPAIQLTGGGEPSAHPQFEHVLEACLSRNLELALVTNGVNLHPTGLNLLKSAKWVRFSIDAGTSETYCRVRNVSENHWHKVWSNIKTLCQIRDDCKSPLIVGVGFVVTKDNYQDVVKCAMRARDAGVNNLRISAVFQNDGESYFKDFYKEAQQLCQEAQQLANDKFLVFNLFGERIEDLHQQSPNYEFCGIQNFVTYIGGDQNVYRCCVLAYNKQGQIGSLLTQRFKDLWNSETKKKGFDSFDATKCPQCMFNSKNRTILYAISTDPQHVNFV